MLEDLDIVTITGPKYIEVLVMDEYNCYMLIEFKAAVTASMNTICLGEKNSRLIQTTNSFSL